MNDRAAGVALHALEHPPTPTLIEALAAVMAELPGMAKGDKSPEGYLYRGVETITKELQPLLARHRVVFVPSARVTQILPSPAMKEGWQDVYVEVDWTIVGPDGSTLTARTNGIGRDKSDKGANKAQTQAFKYLLLHLLCIADKADDADGQTYEHDRAAPTRPLLNPKSVENFLSKCAALGVDPADVVAVATDNRTGKATEVYADEAQALRAALEAVPATTTAVGEPVSEEVGA